MTKKLHRQQNPQINIRDFWPIREQVYVIDVRSPKEFSDGMIPEAVNLPLLSDAERSRVGILYKRFGQEKAIDEGYNIFEPKLTEFYSYFEHFSKNKRLIVYCARGGMRSKVITAFARSLGFDAVQLSGGYKAFRQFNLDRLDESLLQSDPVVLHGKTGVGKTLVLAELENSLDLEGMAQHRGSLFGGIGKQPVTQKEFEARILQRIEQLEPTKPVFIEGESRKIGDLIIPPKLFESMRSSRATLLEASLETRVSRTIDEYITNHPDNLSEIRRVIGLLVKELGKRNVQRLQTEFDKGEYDKCFGFILVNYYDKKYAHSLKNLVFEDTISTEDISDAVNRLNALTLS